MISTLTIAVAVAAFANGVVGTLYVRLHRRHEAMRATLKRVVGERDDARWDLSTLARPLAVLAIGAVPACVPRNADEQRIATCQRQVAGPVAQAECGSASR